MSPFAHSHATLLAMPLVVTLTCVAANAQTTDWFETIGGHVRLVVAPPQPGDAELRGIIDVRLKPGWKTYWRDPGSSGVPPQLGIAGSKGLAHPEIHFPTPVWIDNPYGDFAGYDGSVALPFTLSRTANGGAELKASVFMGICEDICIPIQADFDLTIGYASGTTMESIRVQASHAALPDTALDGLAVTVSDDPPAGHALIVVESDLDTPPQLFVHAEDGTQFKPPRIVGSSDQRTRFALEPVKAAGAGRMVEAIITVRAGDGGYEARHMLPVAPTDK